MMGRSSLRAGTPEPRRAARSRIVLAIAAVVVLGAAIGLAAYVRSAARDDGESQRDPDPPAKDPAAGPANEVPAPRVESQRPADPALELPQPAAAEDRYLGAPGSQSAPPATTRPAAPPPEPPRAPTDPDPPGAEDPRDLEAESAERPVP
jgi:hypothetical protein